MRRPHEKEPNTHEIKTKRAGATDRRAELDAVLKRAHVVGVRQLDHVQVVLFLHVLHPFVGLALRVDHQRPAVGVAVEQLVLVTALSVIRGTRIAKDQATCQPDVSRFCKGPFTHAIFHAILVA